MMKQEYAIVDIETTGGNASGSRITEICIVIHDGTDIIERWETLVNPQKEIPLAIFALTGITNEMVQHAPIFDAIAEKVWALLTDRIFVAHNVNFDYSFVRHQLEQAGYPWTAKKLCTVRAARKIKPGLGSYSLGKLCKSLDIPLVNQHRAGGDTDATTILFSRLLAWDTEEIIDQMVKKNAQDQRLPPNLPPEDFEQLPEKPGVYYFYNELKEVIYVGKAINLKKRVTSHFSGHKITPQRQYFLRDTYGISFEVCATELIALLLECSEINRLWPKYNRALKRYVQRYGLFEYEAYSGYKYLAIGKITKNQRCIEVFHSAHEGSNLLRRLAEQFEIDYRFCKYGIPGAAETLIHHDRTDLPDVTQHNQQIEEAIAFYQQSKPSFAILEHGRSGDERSCIWVEKGHFYGMGYMASDIALVDITEVKEYVSRYKSNPYMMQLIQTYAQKHPSKLRHLTQA